ncbi:MAG: type III restriction-modification system endonuclease [Bacteroidales bacterium]|jgi:type III restriction enzyme|nr:type III restriction-modification system endonuclease [Bacteroidales bacterium]
MKIHLEQLEHQENAINAVLEAFPAVETVHAPSLQHTDIYANPVLQNAGMENQFIDCKMETGTGKTYVYTRLMYELHQRLGLFKFIIVVPSLAIKEGTKNFIIADYARQHFAKFFQNTKLELQVLNAGDFDGKKGRKTIPSHISAFCEATRNEKNTIQCLLISDKGHLDKASTALFKSDYDQTLFGSCPCPADAIAQTRPIVIIDEPHRLKRSGKSYQNIIEKLKPQMILRFGATFPKTESGANKGVPDYYRGLPIFDLGAVESFNQGLVKAVDISFADLSETSAEKKYKVSAVTAKKLILKKGNQEFEINAGEMLPSDFEGNVTYEGGTDKKLSNDLELETGMDLLAGVFSNSYQEILLSQAIEAHFDKEEKNFFRVSNAPKIKTVSLFFIDSIKSYRDENGWLKQTFEKLLNSKLDSLITKYTNATMPEEKDYLSFLQATKHNLKGESQTVHAGYFAEDKGKGDAAIQAEIDDILSNKEKMLSFKDEASNWNTRRFLFSKWTLREGWDNPNVFTICKLRTSGSEISKIQEVGRGLRLPVDERGNRLSNEEFRLNYIIGWDEKDFAQKLVGEINSDAKVVLNKEKLTAEMIKIITDYRKISEEELLEMLDDKGIIKRNNDFKEGGYDKLLADYPELLQTQLQRNKVTAPNMQIKRSPIKLRQDNWRKIAGFWQQVSKRYMLCLERLKPEDFEKLIDDVLAQNIFDLQGSNIVTYGTQADEDGNRVNLVEESRAVYVSRFGLMPYSDFIKKLHKRTFIPIQLLHKKIWAKLSETAIANRYEKDEINAFINEQSLNRFANAFEKAFQTTFSAKYTYDSLDYSAETSIMKNGSFVAELERGLVGSNDANDVKDNDKNLYDLPLAYDSEIEHEVLKVTPPEQVVVYGKLPKKSIKLPTYTGGTTSPDFVYAIKKPNTEDISLHFVVETKSDNLRLSDQIAIEAQEKAFAAMGGNIEWRMESEVSQFVRDLRKLSEG